MTTRTTRFATLLLGLAAATPAASAQTRRVDAQLSRDFPNQRRDVKRQDDINGTRVFEIDIAGDKGESNVVITEAGDYLFKSVPARPGNLPDPVTDVLGTKLLTLKEHEVDYEDVLEIARTCREQIDWELLREQTTGSPYAKAFFTLVDQLELTS